MTKSLTDAALDAALTFLAERASLMTLCEGAPGSYFDASERKAEGGSVLASVALTPGLNAGDFAIADGSVTGRRLNVASRSAVSVTDSGTADHLAIMDGSSAKLLAVTELTDPVVLSAGAIVGVKSFASEILDPV